VYHFRSHSRSQRTVCLVPAVGFDLVVLAVVRRTREVGHLVAHVATVVTAVFHSDTTVLGLAYLSRLTGSMPPVPPHSASYYADTHRTVYVDQLSHVTRGNYWSRTRCFSDSDWRLWSARGPRFNKPGCCCCCGWFPGRLPNPGGWPSWDDVWGCCCCDDCCCCCCEGAGPPPSAGKSSAVKSRVREGPPDATPPLPEGGRPVPACDA